MTRNLHLAAVLLILVSCVGVEQPVFIDGPVEPPPNVEPLLGCASACHGDSASNAPPRDTTGGTDTSLRSVGAHRSHLDPAPTWHRRLECSDCHRVPTSVSDEGHLDTPLPAELTFGAIAQTGGSVPDWNGQSCNNVYCHGATLTGGSLNEPTWTTVDDTQDACGTCHGFPPLAPHPDATDCGGCHPTIQPGTVDFLDPDSHINGLVDTNFEGGGGGGTGACDACHGSEGVAAPPLDLAGNSDPTIQTVGAHRKHLNPDPAWHRPLYCSQCHVVPVTVDAPTHIDGDQMAELTFDSLNPQATYDRATATCDNLYCHGSGRVSDGTMVFTASVDLRCNSCHEDGANEIRRLSGRHHTHWDENIRCSGCHGAVVDQQMNVLDRDLHINGVHDIQMENGGVWDASTKVCSNLACHGNKPW